MDNIYLKETRYCNYSHPEIEKLASTLKEDAQNDLQFIEKAFYHVRDMIRFGADIWKVKASETLKKKYGPCYGKNILFIALLRNHGIECTLSANPMKRTFTRPSVGMVHRFFSNPFYHCFTKVRCNGKWMHIDPTLDVENYNTFFKPLNVNWDVNWNPNGMTPLYDESIMGESVDYHDIDEGVNRNMDSYFMFKHEPDFLLKLWLAMGNGKMWGAVDKRARRQLMEETA